MKNRVEKFAFLTADIYALHKCQSGNLDLISNLCACIWMLAKGTKSETDAKELIEQVCKGFFD